MEEDRAANQRSAFSLSFTLALSISNGFGLSTLSKICYKLLQKTIESLFCYEKHQTWKSWTVLNNILEWLLIQQEMQRFLINILLGGLCIYLGCECQTRAGSAIKEKKDFRRCICSFNIRKWDKTIDYRTRILSKIYCCHWLAIWRLQKIK